MACVYGGIHTSFRIGTDTVTINSNFYGDQWVGVTTAVNGSNLPTSIGWGWGYPGNGTINVTLGGVGLRLVYSGRNFYMYFASPVNQYNKNWTPTDGTSFMEIGSAWGDGTDECGICNYYTANMPVIQEIV